MKYSPQEEDICIANNDDITVYYGTKSDIITIVEDSYSEAEVMMSREEAVATAKAILKHFGESYA